MAPVFAIFALVLGANGLNIGTELKQMKVDENLSVEVLEQTVRDLNKYLASFEKKDLKDKTTFQEYKAVREAAKSATEALERKRWTLAAPPAPTDWTNDDDEFKVLDEEAAKLPKEAEFKKAEPEDMLQGTYSDPNHAGADGAGQRTVSLDESTVTMTGVDEPGAAPWTLTGSYDKEANTVSMDFSPKGGPKDLEGKVDSEGIHWPDGNVWKKAAALKVQAPAMIEKAKVKEAKEESLADIRKELMREEEKERKEEAKKEAEKLKRKQLHLNLRQKAAHHKFSSPYRAASK